MSLQQSGSQLRTNPCHGLILNSNNWLVIPGTPIQANFPWLCTRKGPDQLPFNIEIIEGVLSAWSHNCLHSVIDGDSACFLCSQIASQVELLAQNASERKSHMCYTLLTPIQLLFLLDEHWKGVEGFGLLLPQVRCVQPRGFWRSGRAPRD